MIHSYGGSSAPDSTCITNGGFYQGLKCTTHFFSCCTCDVDAASFSFSSSAVRRACRTRQSSVADRTRKTNLLSVYACSVQCPVCMYTPLVSLLPGQPVGSAGEPVPPYCHALPSLREQDEIYNKPREAKLKAQMMDICMQYDILCMYMYIYMFLNVYALTQLGIEAGANGVSGSESVLMF